MKENRETTSPDRKPQGEASVSPSTAKASDRENAQHKEGEKKKPKAGRLSHAAGRRK
jgi:hypothetical protein